MRSVSAGRVAFAGALLVAVTLLILFVLGGSEPDAVPRPPARVTETVAEVRPTRVTAVPVVPPESPQTEPAARPSVRIVVTSAATGAEIPGALLHPVGSNAGPDAQRPADAATAIDADDDALWRVTAPSHVARIVAPRRLPDREGARVVALRAARVLRGVVRTTDGRPVPGARIRAVPTWIDTGPSLDHPSALSAVTATDGAFAADAADPDLSYRIWVSAPGLVNPRAVVASPADESIEITVVEFRAIVLRLVSSSGDPILFPGGSQGVEVGLGGSSGTPVGVVVPRDAWELAGLPEPSQGPVDGGMNCVFTVVLRDGARSWPDQPMRVTARVPGYEPVTAIVMPCEVQAPLRTTEIRLNPVALRVGSVRVGCKVLGGGRGEAARVTLTVVGGIASAGRPSTAVISFECVDGSAVEVSGVRVGKCVVRADCGYPTAGLAVSPSEVIVREGVAEDATVEVTPAAGATVEARVFDRDGDPVSGPVSLELGWNGRPGAVPGEWNENVARVHFRQAPYVLRHLRPGAYTLGLAGAPRASRSALDAAAGSVQTVELRVPAERR